MGDQCCGGNLRPDAPELRNHLRALKDIDFELAYLALLTWEGLKPLSRWEKPLDDAGLGLLQKAGLLTKRIRRRVKTSREVIETIFSRTPACIQLYQESFADTPIDKSAQTQRLEGFFFGYPSCCVEQYIRKPYAPNSLADEEQKILFHWACRDCKVTPVLLPAYKGVHGLLSRY
jgi:hypothetical protein